MSLEDLVSEKALRDLCNSEKSAIETLENLSNQREKLERIDTKISTTNRLLEIANNALAWFSDKKRLETDKTPEVDQVDIPNNHTSNNILGRLRDQALLLNREIDYQNRLMDRISTRCDILSGNMGKFN